MSWRPSITAGAAFLPFAVIPFAGTILPPEITFYGYKIDLTVAALNQGVIGDTNIGLLYIFAMGSLGVYGAILGGWASNNKYSLLGGLRLCAQMVSYELALGLSVIGVIMLAGSLSTVKIVEAQKYIPFIVYQPLGFVLFMIAAMAECGRTPFDLIECENELVAGYQTEYSSMKWGLFMMGEYAHIIVASAPGHHPVPGRLAGAGAAPRRLVHGQDLRPGLLLHLGKRHLPPLPV